MVKTIVTATSSYVVSKPRIPLVVELVGLAGAGKSTLARALNQKDEKLLIADEIELRKLAHLPIFASQVSSLLPVLLRPHRPSRWFTWDEIKSLVYLKGWHQVLRRQAANTCHAILLDHGPIFKLATLQAFGPKRLESPRSEGWWQEMFALWASTLDAVIWLEASRSNLLERINSRSQKHFVKGKSEHEASEFLDRYQQAYELILTGLGQYKKLPLFHFDTSHIPIEQIVAEVCDTCLPHAGEYQQF